VALLPYLGETRLFKQYRLDQPWDSDGNRKLLKRMPDVFRATGAPAGTQNAAYFVVTGPKTMFSGTEGVSISEVMDRTNMTVMVVETKRDIPWTKPVDIRYDTQGPLPQLGGFHENGFNVLVATGEAMFLAPPPKEEWLRSFLSKSYYPDLDRQIVAQLTGRPAPDFTLKNLAGQEVSLSKLIAGKVALVSFTACRCAGCRLEAPVLAKLYDQHRSGGLVVLAVAGGPRTSVC
jgi:hypothetical protein